MTRREKEVRALIDEAALLTGGKPRTVRNRDGSIDGEVVIPIGRGENYNEKVEAVEELWRGRTVKGATYASGFTWHSSNAEPSRSKYERIGGVNRISFHYYDDLEGANAYSEEVYETVRRRKYRKPNQAIIRILVK